MIQCRSTSGTDRAPRLWRPPVVLPGWLTLVPIHPVARTARNANRFEPLTKYLIACLLIQLDLERLPNFNNMFEFFRTMPLAFVDWVIIVAATSPVLWVGEVLRWLDRQRQGEPSKPALAQA